MSRSFNKALSFTAAAIASISTLGTAFLSPVSADAFDLLVDIGANTDVNVSNGKQSDAYEVNGTQYANITFDVEVNIPDLSGAEYDEITSEILGDILISYEGKLPANAEVIIDSEDAEILNVPGYSQVFLSSAGQARSAFRTYPSNIEFNVEVLGLPLGTHTIHVDALAGEAGQFVSIEETGNTKEGEGVVVDLNGTTFDFDVEGNEVVQDLEEAEEGSVYRFYNATTGKHVMMSSYEEANNLYKNNKAWAFDGVVFMAFEYEAGECNPDPSYLDESALLPVYRFWNGAAQSHVFAMGAEVTSIDQNPAWQKEGVVFCAVKTDIEAEGLVEAKRFYRASNTSHVYSVDSVEVENIKKNPAYQLEGTAFQVYTKDSEFNPEDTGTPEPDPEPTENVPFKEGYPELYAQHLADIEANGTFNAIIMVHEDVDVNEYVQAIPGVDITIGTVSSNWFSGVINDPLSFEMLSIDPQIKHIGKDYDVIGH